MRGESEGGGKGEEVEGEGERRRDAYFSFYLVLDLLVGQHEDRRLRQHARAAVERLEVLEQVVGVVRLRERDLEARRVADVRGEARERLLA